jgi:hypothetical protein
MVEEHALARKTVNVGRVVDAGAVGTNGLGGVVVSHDEDDVWTAMAASRL